jgi:AcrR family transcriptional regulator
MGRPRNPSVDEAVIRATVSRLVQDGYTGMSVANVAADAGTTRPTVYLRWPTKQALVVDAVRSTLSNWAETTPDSWHELPPRQRLLRLLDELRPSANGQHRLLWATLLAESHRIPELLGLLNEQVFEPRVQAIVAMLTSMRERGEIRADVNIAHVAKMLYAVRLFDGLRTGEAADELDEQSVALLWPSIATHPSA